MIELKVIEEINHHKSSSLFVVKELECGSELFSSRVREEAEEEMLEMISSNSALYFTNQKVVMGYSYRMTNVGSGSDKYGNCEVCDKHVDSTYLLTQMRRYFCSITQQEQITVHKCFSYFGHRKCLSEKTNEE